MKKRTKEKLIKRCEGIISILLAVLMLPFFSLAAILVEAGRYQSAMRALDQAMGSSAISTLAGYDSYLLQRFGLLAMSQSDDDDALTSTFTKYLNAQKTTDMKGVQTDTISAAGVDPLADPEILMQQIQQYSSVLGPVQMIREGLNLDDLVKELEKQLREAFGMLTMLSAFSSAVDMIDKQISVCEDMDDTKKHMKDTKKLIKAYDDAFETWTGDAQSLIAHLNTPCPAPDPEKDPDDHDKWVEKYNTLADAEESSRDGYAGAIDDLIDAVDTLVEKIEALIQTEEEAVKAVGGFAVDAVNAQIDMETKKYTDTYLRGDENATRKKDFETYSSNMKDVTSTFSAGAESIQARTKETLRNLDPEGLAAVSLQLIDLKASVENYAIGPSSSAPGESYHSSSLHESLETLCDPKELDELMDAVEEEMDNNAAFDTLMALVDMVGSLFNLEGMYDSELNVKIDTDYYKDNYGGLPSQKSRTGAYSLENPYKAQDEERSKDYLEKIDPDYDPDDPYGLNANSAASKWETVLRRWETLLDKCQDVTDADGFIDTCKAALDAFVALFDLIAAFLDWVGTLLANLAKSIYEKVLLSTYLCYNLPNRTTFKSGRTMTNYSYAKAGLTPSVTGSGLPIAGYSVPEQTGYSFSGAELEYIIWGGTSERANQCMQAALLFGVRFLLDLPVVLSNTEVQAMSKALSGVPYIGPLLGVLLQFVVAAGEPLVDVYILVNGGKVPVYKTTTVYLTPSGLPDLLGQMAKLSLSESQQKAIGKAGRKAFDIKEPKPEAPQKNAFEREHSFNFDDAWSSYTKGLLDLDYTEHSWILLCFLPGSNTCLNRLADLIQMEMTTRNRVTNTSMSQNLTGEYDSFDIDQAYTTLRVQASGSLKQVLPLPALKDPGASGKRSGKSTMLADKGWLSFDRVIYRGY